MSYEDVSNMTQRQRYAYWRNMGTLELKEPNFVGEKPDPQYSVDDYIRDHEAAFQYRINEGVAFSEAGKGASGSTARTSPPSQRRPRQTAKP